MRIFLLVAFALLILIAAITNPSKQEHQEKVKELVYDSLKDKGLNYNDQSFVGLINKTAVNAMVDYMTPQFVRVDNYVLFSITKVQMDSSSKRIGFGAFGNVFISLPESYLKSTQEVNDIKRENSEANVKADEYYDNQNAHVESAEISNAALSIRDSIVIFYNETLNRLDSFPDINNNLTHELEYNKSKIAGLKSEINQIVSNKNAAIDELRRAKSLIYELNKWIDTLVSETSHLNNE